MSGLRRGVMPTNQALGMVSLFLLVLAGGRPTTSAVPVLPAKSMPSRCAAQAVPMGAGDGGHAVGDGLPVVGGERDGLVAGAGKGLVDGLLHLAGDLAGEDDVGAAQDAAGGDAAESARASWMGVAVTAPWPMPTEMVSPAYHFLVVVLQLPVRSEGMVPEASSGRSTPVFWPRPSEVAYLRDRVDAEAVGEGVVEGVAGVRDGVVDVDRAVVTVAGDRSGRRRWRRRCS